MGLFSSRPESNNTWAAIPGEPLTDTTGAPQLDAPVATDALGIFGGANLSFEIPLTVADAPQDPATTSEPQDIPEDADTPTE